MEIYQTIKTLHDSLKKSQTVWDFKVWGHIENPDIKML